MKFSYFLLKPEFSTIASVLDHHEFANETYARLQPKDVTELGVPEALATDVAAFFGVHDTSAPKWMQFVDRYFVLDGDGDQRKTRMFSLILLMLVGGRVFVVTMGAGWLRVPADAVVEDFGKAVSLNWVAHNSVLEIESSTTGQRGRVRIERLNRQGSIYDFTAPDDLTVLRKFGGSVAYGSTEQDILGGVSARFKGEATYEDLVAVCQRLLQQYLDNGARPAEFSELEPVTLVRSDQDRERLLRALYDRIERQEPLDISFGRPPFIDQLEEPAHVRYKEPGRCFFSAYAIPIWNEAYMRAVIKFHLTDYRKFKEAQIYFRTSDTKGTIQFTEVLSYLSPSDGSKRYLLDNGSWFEVDADFYDRIDSIVGAIQVLPRNTLPGFRKGTAEGAYNASVPSTVGFTDCSNLDRAAARMQIRRSRVEACDIFKPTGELIAVKQGTGSDSVAYVCSQALDAAHCLFNYPEYWTFIRGQLRKPYLFDPILNGQRFQFVVALAADSNLTLPADLSFKCKLALLNLKRGIQALGFRVAFLHIPYT